MFRTARDEPGDGRRREEDVGRDAYDMVDEAVEHSRDALDKFMSAAEARRHVSTLASGILGSNLVVNAMQDTSLTLVKSIEKVGGNIVKSLNRLADSVDKAAAAAAAASAPLAFSKPLSKKPLAPPTAPPTPPLPDGDLQKATLPVRGTHAAQQKEITELQAQLATEQERGQRYLAQQTALVLQQKITNLQAELDKKNASTRKTPEDKDHEVSPQCKHDRRLQRQAMGLNEDDYEGWYKVLKGSPDAPVVPENWRDRKDMIKQGRANKASKGKAPAAVLSLKRPLVASAPKPKAAAKPPVAKPKAAAKPPVAKPPVVAINSTDEEGSPSPKKKKKRAAAPSKAKLQELDEEMGSDNVTSDEESEYHEGSDSSSEDDESDDNAFDGNSDGWLFGDGEDPDEAMD